MIRIVEGETFNKETADIISKTEPEKIVKVEEDKYAYERHIALTKLENGKYQYSVTTPDGKVVKSEELYHPFKFPKKITYFNEDGTKANAHAFVDIYGKETEVEREYNSFMRVIPKRTKNVVILTTYTPSTDSNRMLDIFLNATKIRKYEPNEASGVFAAYLYNYSTKGENILFDGEEDYVSYFADDVFYKAVKNEERKRWAETINPSKQIMSLQKAMTFEETKSYLERKKLIEIYRSKALSLLQGKGEEQ